MSEDPQENPKLKMYKNIIQKVNGEMVHSFFDK